MQQPRASSRGRSADAGRRARSPGPLSRPALGGPQTKRSGPPKGTRAQPAGGPGSRLPAPDSPRAPRSPVVPGAMRPPAPAPCPGRTRWNPWRGFLPLTLALFVGMGRAQRDPVGRVEPVGRDASRLWRPGGSYHAAAAAKVYSLFREQDAPGPGSPPAERAQPGWGSPRRPVEPEARRPPRAQQPPRVRPPAQTWRSSRWGQQQPAPRARAASALPRFGTLQRPRAAPPTPPRGRLTG